MVLPGTQRERDTNGFFLPGNVLVKEACLGWAEEGLPQPRRFLEPGEAIQPGPVFPELLLKWAEMRIFTLNNNNQKKNHNQTASMDISGQPGFFPSLSCCRGDVQVLEEGALCPIRSRSACGRGRGERSAPAGGARAGAAVQGERQQSGLVVGVLTVKASDHWTWQCPVWSSLVLIQALPLLRF